MSREGKNHKIFVSATPLASPEDAGAGWIEMEIVENTSGELARDEVTFKTREQGGSEQTLGGTLSGTKEISWAYLAGDSAADAILDAIIDGTKIAVLDLDGPNTSGAKGTKGNYTVLNYKDDKPIDGVVKISGSLKLADANFNMKYTV